LFLNAEKVTFLFFLGLCSKTDPRAFHREQRLNDSVVEAWSKWNIDKNLIDESGNHKDGLELPRHQEKAGMNTGLSFLINPQLSQYHCTGQDSAGFRVPLNELSF
jgi:hypothetical protein